MFRNLVERAKLEKRWFDYVEYCRCFSGGGGVSAINELPLSITDEEYRLIVHRTWTWSYNIWEHRDQWREILGGARRSLGSFTSPSDLNKLKLLSDPLTVYRGCCEKNQRGFSWTLDKQRAEYYAAFTQGWTKAKQRLIISGVVRKVDVIAYITTRNEEEIVVLPENVTEIKTEDITDKEEITEEMMKRLGKATR